MRIKKASNFKEKCHIFRFELLSTRKKFVHVGSAPERKIYDENYDLVHKMLILNFLNCEWRALRGQSTIFERSLLHSKIRDSKIWIYNNHICTFYVLDCVVYAAVRTLPLNAFYVHLFLWLTIIFYVGTLQRMARGCLLMPSFNRLLINLHKNAMIMLMHKIMRNKTRET